MNPLPPPILNRILEHAVSLFCPFHHAQVIATCRGASKELAEMGNVQIITGIDVMDIESCKKLGVEINSPVDILINNAGYFYEPVEKIDSLNFEEVS
jgi:short-subunit dehydrogenase